MTTDDSREQAIEQAAKAITEVGNALYWEWDDMPRDVATALADADLLTTDAPGVACDHGHTEWPASSANWTRAAWRRKAEYMRGKVHTHMHRAERAEVEVAKLRAERDALQAHVERLNAAVQRHSDRAAAAQDENLTQFAEAVAKVTPCTCSAQRARADRAVAERDELADKVRALADTARDQQHLSRDRRRTHPADCPCGDWALITPNDLRALLDGGEQA